MPWLEQIENCLNITTPLLLNLHLPNAMFIHNLLSKRFNFELVGTDYNNNYVEDENNIKNNNTKNRLRIRIRDIDKPHYINLVSVYKNHLYFTYFLQVTIYEEINNELEVLKQQMDNEIKKKEEEDKLGVVATSNIPIISEPNKNNMYYGLEIED